MNDIKELIKKTGLGTKKLAEIMGVSDQAIRNWSCGAAEIPVKRKIQLLEIAKKMDDILKT